ncbi:MAG TPA: 2-oxoacid:ferredoxin oxidoreductase subunit gamma [Dehalococcoidia bacterium]|nr:2-oxoacid:ferredoxin oxidoreductase subunit gamma [Dehalococcoidia bacterium]
MSQRYEIRLAGEGGQGMILAGAILAEAAAIYDGRNVVMTQAYAPQQRGGFTETELVLSDGEIDYPKILAANLLLALTQDAFNRHSRQMAKGGLILVDPSLVDATEVEDADIERLPLKEMAIEVTGSAMAINLVAPGGDLGTNQVRLPGGPQCCPEETLLREKPPPQ